VRAGEEPPAAFHGVQVPDYVLVCALTVAGRIPVVRQFRPIVGRETLEFPAGLVDPGEDVVAAAAREFGEETGCVAGPLTHLGSHFSDTGRLTNRTHAFFAEADEGRQAVDDEVEALFLTRAELDAAIADGAFCHFMHVGAYAMARSRGLV
jgi:ADP-ribose pyrophosphatase